MTSISISVLPVNTPTEEGLVTQGHPLERPGPNHLMQSELDARPSQVHHHTYNV
jgi:hypothetical protein